MNQDRMESNNSSNFIVINDIIPEAIYDIRYYTDYNFVGERIDGYEEPLAILTKECANILKDISKELLNKGYKLKIYDAYRPVKAVDHFLRWSKDLDDARMKEYFYPNFDKKYLFEQGFLKKNSTHSRGSTIDLTLVDAKTNEDIDMGGTFDFFGDISLPDYELLTKEQKENRKLLKETMLKHGFKQSKLEWWHYTLIDEPYKDTYFTFPINRKAISNKKTTIL